MFDEYLSVQREELAVFVSGIVSMGLEILAGRVLAPQFGSTVYTWGSIIGVSLLALSLGYHRGGQLAHRAEPRSLDWLLVAASVYIVLIMAVQDAVIGASGALPLGSRYASLVPVAVLFGPPTYFLGFISPYAAEFSDHQGKGRASGHFYAVGTAGSLVGAFGTTFLLIPFFSVNTSYIVFAAIAVLPLMRGLRRLSSYTVVAVLLASWGLADVAATPGDTVFETSTPYQNLRVADENGVRTMYLDGQPQSAMYIDNRSGYPWTYPRYFHLAKAWSDDVQRALFVGGGGFSGPKAFADDGVAVDVYELDPGVVQAARDYFNVSPSDRLDVSVGDGRELLEDADRRYEVIVLDAYRQHSVPFHLTTEAFYEEVRSKLAEGGVVVVNTIATPSGPGSRFARASYKTMDRVFDTVRYVPTANSSLAQNVMVFGVRGAPSRSLGAAARRTDYDVRYGVRHAFEPATEDVPVLSDRYAPVDSLLEPLVGRRRATGSSP